MPRPHFGSDNASGVAPEILEALASANAGGVDSYGADALTESLEARFAEVFETGVSVLPVGTGTIANSLAISFVAPPWGAVYCHRDSHIVVDEANGPEFFSGGAKLVGLPGEHGRLDPETVRAVAAASDPSDVHHPMRAALSITQATEWGAVHSVDEIAALGAVAREFGLAFHMDGARFANAVAALGRAPADATWRAGVDVLSFGATKNGCLAAEALVVFGERRREFDRLRRLHKRAGQLYSKMRFLAAQLDAYLAEGRWLAWAAHANAMARRLAGGLAAFDGAELLHPVQANEIFLKLPDATFERMKTAGFGFYPPRPSGDGSSVLRLVTAFDTDPADVDALIAAAGEG